MSFQEDIKNHLANYKKLKLGINEDGIYKYKEKNLLKKHILPKRLARQNIIKYYRDLFYESKISEIDYHKYFHHLNSSQALCINLFFPLIFERKLSIILNLLNIKKLEILEYNFEKESDIEVSESRKTNFDFYLKLSGNTKIYFEIKYTEAEFGKAKNDIEHNKKFNLTYEPLLQNNPFIKNKYHNSTSFLSEYQIMRNICHIEKNSYVVFVYPTKNKKINQQAIATRDSILTDTGKLRFKILPIEHIVSKIQEIELPKKLASHYQEFNEKYIFETAN